MLRPAMTPAPGDHVVRYVGDRLRVDLAHPAPGHAGWRAFLRTNLTRGDRAREEILARAGTLPGEALTFAGAAWRDLPLQTEEGGWSLDLVLTEPGPFRAKAYAVDPAGYQHWPAGDDLGVSVLPDRLRSANLVYCAFPRMFGPARAFRETRDPAREAAWAELDGQGVTVIPPSGTLRDLTACLPHIFDTLGCRILHLLPVGPVPTTFARMGRFGSPYAQLDLTAIDPALVVFDRRTTAVDQFRELADGVHLRGGSLFLDIVVNHTGWSSRLMETHPEWFRREPDGSFHSPGAWGVTWGDLAELEGGPPAFWETVAESLLTWCRRGVDGFRCDAGYLVPMPVWQYLGARVRREFPDCAFLLEGLGGSWEATERLLGEGGLQWAYSELFQNHEPRPVAAYLDHCLRHAPRLGPLVHFSETHDNDRLAVRGATWSLMRTRLCGLASHCGAYGFTTGVEWLAAEKLDVHEARGLAWGAEPNLVPELAALHRLLAEHPCFFDGAAVARLSPEDSPVLALARRSAEGLDRCLVLVNLDVREPRELVLAETAWTSLGAPALDLLGAPPEIRRSEGRVGFLLHPGAAHCLADRPAPAGLSGEAYRARRAQAAWGFQRLAEAIPAEAIGPCDWRLLATRVDRDPAAFLAALPRLDPARASADLLGALDAAASGDRYPAVALWGPEDAARVLPVPPGHRVLIEDALPFSATLRAVGALDLNLRSIPAGGRHFAALPPRPGDAAGLADLHLDRFGEEGPPIRGQLRFCPALPCFSSHGESGLALLTNGRGGMARVHADLGAIASKYDCLLGANLHPDLPCDRHVLVKRLRAWVIADGFLSALGADNLEGFEPGPPARWRFRAHAGDGRTVPVHLDAEMPEGRNAVVLRFSRGAGKEVSGEIRVGLTVRLDLEDRSFHEETTWSPDLDRRFAAATSPLSGRPGFQVRLAADRGLRAGSEGGSYHPEPEWCRGIPHPVEAGRGMRAQGDAWSPGWFELPLPPGGSLSITVDADPQARFARTSLEPHPSGRPESDSFGRQLETACAAFLARRGTGTTVIAGYPWFLDWGRDTLIAVRGLLAGGWTRETLEILRTFGALERDGTLPNRLAASEDGDRDTSDAPLWFALALEEAAAVLGPEVYAADAGGRPLGAVLRNLAAGYLAGTPNGIRVDPGSALVWSPAHFTWMDTAHPAGTPREGYPVELQALWIRLLRQLARLDGEASGRWDTLALQAEASLDRFWLPASGWFADLLAAPAGVPAAQGVPQDHLRPNQLFLVSLGLLRGARARRVVEAAQRHLLVPGALRSLAPLPVAAALEIRDAAGHLLNDPLRPYWGHYEGDEDTRRKPAYHNGTAWVWLVPTFCEALAAAWDQAPEAVAAARAILGSLETPLAEGCVGHLPELLDGDAPHAQRGCDAQAWSATEALRVWLQLSEGLWSGGR
ncbi:amylo-alpha-1,6-glucosidase [Geothrix sp. SG200]|uniref:amylo-alpha-1,6-glucosidase n=1 Tax=Geothrix sp. SG200 TaxID=2922865 RepID=UPI001FADB3AB|nr:amylo-alpha-1,6-glucosidase [Geothrix sp. SG200]